MMIIYNLVPQCAVELGKVVANYKMYGHRQARATNCPGDSLYALIQQRPNCVGSTSKIYKNFNFLILITFS